MSNKTQLSEFSEQQSDMPLFHWVLTLKYTCIEKNIMSCTKISRHGQLNAWRMEITMCTKKFFM